MGTKLALVVGTAMAWSGLGCFGGGRIRGLLARGGMGVASIATGRAGRKSALPFGPFMVVAAIGAMAWGSAVATWVLQSVPLTILDSTKRGNCRCHRWTRIYGGHGGKEQCGAGGRILDRSSRNRVPQPFRSVIEHLSSIGLNPGVVVDGEVVDAEALSGAIRHLVKVGKPGGKDVRLALPASAWWRGRWTFRGCLPRSQTGSAFALRRICCRCRSRTVYLTFVRGPRG